MNPAEVVRQNLLRDTVDRTEAEVIADNPDAVPPFVLGEIDASMTSSLKTLWIGASGTDFDQYIIANPGDGLTGTPTGNIFLIQRKILDSSQYPDGHRLDDPACNTGWLDIILDRNNQPTDEIIVQVDARIQWLLDYETRQQYRGITGNLYVRDPDVLTLYSKGINESYFQLFRYGFVTPPTSSSVAIRYRLEYAKVFGR